jgi:hypothetical protein
MNNLQEIKKEALRQKNKRISRKKEWNKLESRKKMENEALIEQEALFDKQFFNALAYRHIKNREKHKNELLKSLTKN